MKIGIFDPYLDTMAGGERYILSGALCLSRVNDINLFWDTKNSQDIVEQAKYRFGFDLSPLTFVDNIFSPSVSLIDRFVRSREYDLIIYLSDGSIPTIATKLFLHFQTPVEWVKPTLKTKLKLFRVSSIFCNSEYTKSYIDKTFSVQSSVLYPPVMLENSDNLTKKENIILNVGRFGINQQGSSYKKQDVLRDVYKDMVDGGLRDWKLVFVMNADEDDEAFKDFQKECEGYPIELVVNPKNTMLCDYYQKAKIYWHASGIGEDLSKHPDRAEHFGISTVEAMNAGCVPVVYNAGGQKEIVENGESGYLFDTKEELISLTQQLIQRKNDVGRLSQKARERANRFGSDMFCEKLQKMIETS